MANKKKVETAVEKPKKERPRRSQNDLLEEVEKKIAHHQACIEKLEERKQQILNPKTRGKNKSTIIFEKAKEMGMTPDEIAEKLGITLD